MEPVSAIIAAIGSIFKAWVDSKTAKYEAEKNFQLQLAEQEATWDLVALRQSQFSWKDEVLTLVFVSPLVVAWFPEGREAALQWIQFVSALPLWYQIILFGIVAASFGLRWWFKEAGLKVGSKE